MRQDPKNTIVGLLLIGLCCMAFAWMVEMLFFVNLRADQSTKDIIDVLDDVRDMRLLSNLFYVLGVLFILAGGVRVLKLPVAVIDTGE
ncbi:MAG: hypothetical protein JKX70_01880 [Phycisphaerales bacterium]|nr:hypothetical protein [Phycisphaerales bacterium]